MRSISGKSAFVTGGTKGIGLAIARSLAARGAAVFLAARSEQEIDQVVASLRAEHGEQMAGASCDVRSYEQVRSAMQDMERAFGGIDFLINNAGVGCFANVEAMPVSDWTATMETNLSGVFYCCREAIPLMKQRGGGYIINIGSLAGKNAFAGGAAYNASKFGLIGFSEALMQEVRYDHIRVSYVMPGSVDTDFGRSGKQAASKPWKLLPDDVARVVIDLLEMDQRALASRVEIRPSEPGK
jgi:3-oxoacyl-[acyl-carrier protein] reductase